MKNKMIGILVELVVGVTKRQEEDKDLDYLQDKSDLYSKAIAEILDLIAKHYTPNEELMAELRDPNGTIWEHAKRLQEENDLLKVQLKDLLQTQLKDLKRKLGVE